MKAKKMMECEKCEGSDEHLRDPDVQEVSHLGQLLIPSK